MGIAILVIAVCVILFTLGRGAGQTLADAVNTGEKAVKVAPVVASKAKDTTVATAHVVADKSKVAGHKAADVVEFTKTAVGVTALNTVEASKKGFASFKESYKAARQSQAS